ncbi:MAG: malate dehydrogenase [Coriobacteriia bacterium]|nr:malate dehydrogenase [Coriobacteriia bacterium]MCL2750382.1 malate dehydrogenase [Coriobacteriia bacterium]
MTQSYPKVTVVGAGNVGASTALLLLLKNIANVVMIDVAEGVAKGKALDLMHMRSNELFGPSIIGTSDYLDTANSNLVVITAGLPRKPGMTREDLIDINASIVRSVLEAALPVSPEACYLIVTNPLDVLTNMAAQLVDLPPARLIGMGGVLDTSRFVYAIARETGASPSEIDALVIGAHGEAMVPLPSLATVRGEPLLELVDEAALDRIVEATVQGGAEIVRLLETGSAFYAPASSNVKMIEAILGDTGAVYSSCARLQGEYGISDVSLCVPAALGKSGVLKIEELKLSENELLQLQASAQSVKEQVSRIKND